MTELATALLAELDDEALSTLADRLTPMLAQRLGQREEPASWLDVQQAAAYLACPESTRS